MPKTRQEINKEYYEKNKEKVKELVEYNRLKKKDQEKELLRQSRENALNNGQNNYGVHFQHLRMEEKDGKYICECGGQFRKGDQARHSKTKHHFNYLCKILREERIKQEQGLPNRLYEIFMERNHTIIKDVF
jgi:hypothetical protein